MGDARHSTQKEGPCTTRPRARIHECLAYGRVCPFSPLFHIPPLPDVNKIPPDAEPARTTRTIASLAPQVHTAHVTYDTLLGSGGNEPVIALLSSFSDLQQRSEVDTNFKITGTSNTIIVMSLTGSRAVHTSPQTCISSSL